MSQEWEPIFSGTLQHQTPEAPNFRIHSQNVGATTCISGIGPNPWATQRPWTNATDHYEAEAHGDPTNGANGPWNHGDAQKGLAGASKPMVSDRKKQEEICP